jgi:transmembrane sensor
MARMAPSTPNLQFQTDGEDHRRDGCVPANESEDVPIQAAAARWALRLQHPLSDTERKQFDDWLRADPRHADALNDMQETLSALANLPDAAVHRLRNNASGSVSRGAPPPAMSRPQARRRVAMAAGLVLAMGSAWWTWSDLQHPSTEQVAYEAPVGEQLRVALSDGSEMWLDSGTRAQVRYDRRRREVRIDGGQAMFAVRSDAARPFAVALPDVGITVVGTRFAVRRLPGEGGALISTVAVEEGRVRVAPAASGDSMSGADPGGGVLLSAGQSVSTSPSGQLQAPSPVAAVAAWREGRLEFRDTPLGLALAEFERYGPTGLRITDPGVARLRVAGSFQLRGARQFAEALPQLLPVRLEARGHVTEIVAR